jgi:hypothetical protein
MTVDRSQPHYRIALDPEEGTVIVNVQDFDYKDYTFANENVYATVEEAAADNWQKYWVELSAEDSVSVDLELTADEVRVIEKLVHAFEHELARGIYPYAPSIRFRKAT